MNYYPRNIGDWRTATYNLTHQQRGIYSDLIDTYYDKEEPLTANIERIAQDHGCNSPGERSDLAYILDRYFELRGSVYHHLRCDEEIAHFHARCDAASAAGKASASKRALARAERKRNAGATTVQRDGNDGSTNAQRESNERGTSSQLPKTEDRRDKDSGSSESRAQSAPPPTPKPAPAGAAISIPEPPPATPPHRPTRKCPKDFEVTALMLQWAMVEIGLDEATMRRETDKFRDHTFSRAISDWVATWRNWMRKAGEYSNHRSHQRGGIGAALEKQQQTSSFIDAVKGNANAARRAGALDVEARVVRDGEEYPLDPAD